MKGLFFDAKDAAVGCQFGDPEALGVLDLLQQEMSPLLLPLKGLHSGRQVFLHDVVAKNDAAALAGAETMRRPERLD